MNARKILLLVLFLIIVVFELVLSAFLVLDRRMVIGHDGFELLAQQWFFINSKVSNHQIPLWTPYMAHGTPTWWYFLYSRIDIFTNIVMVFSHWIKDLNFLVLYYAGLLFDKFVLLVGVWLLAKRYFQNPATVFFVASTVMATTVTFSQNSFTLVMFYILPLIIYLLHRFFDSWDWKWLFLTVFLFCTVSINVYYFIPIISLAVFLYFFTYYFSGGMTLFKGFKITVKDLGWIILTLLVGFVLAAIYFLGHDPLIFWHSSGREAGGISSLNAFLYYGRGADLNKWWELLLGMSPQLDYTLYMGLLSLPLVVLGALLGKNNNKYPFVLGAIFFLFFSLATPVSVAGYYLWPLMKFYRHISYVAPLIKLYMCFIAGFGFEQLFFHEKNQDSKAILYKSLLAVFLLSCNGLFLCAMVINPQIADFILHQIGGVKILDCFSLSFVSNTLRYMAVLSFFGAVIFFVRPFVKFPRYAFSFLLVFMIFHCLDVYWYAYQQIQLRTFKMTQAQYALLNFQKIPFVKRRLPEKIIINPREELVNSLQGTICDTASNFTLSEHVKPKYRSDFYLKPFDDLFKVFKYDIKSSLLLKLAGSTEDKIQFFSQAYPVSKETISLAMRDKTYAGDILFYQFLNKSLSQVKVSPLDLSQNQRLTIPYEVSVFSPNEVIINVDTKNQSGLWMQYCDVWNSSWKAEVNGQPQEIYIGNLAYKALPLEKGKNTVRFYCESRTVSWLYSFFMISSLFWVILLGWLVVV